MSHNGVSIVHPEGSFAYGDARRIFDVAVRAESPTVVVDLKHAEDATTSAFAQLILLRRALLREGRDLRLDGLRDRTATVYQINRLDLVLPLRSKDFA
jgi:MFS superfamily sulfate permease-like transporter